MFKIHCKKRSSIGFTKSISLEQGGGGGGVGVKWERGERGREGRESGERVKNLRDESSKRSWERERN